MCMHERKYLFSIITKIKFQTFPLPLDPLWRVFVQTIMCTTYTLTPTYTGQLIYYYETYPYLQLYD